MLKFWLFGVPYAVRKPKSHAGRYSVKTKPNLLVILTQASDMVERPPPNSESSLFIQDFPAEALDNEKIYLCSVWIFTEFISIINF